MIALISLKDRPYFNDDKVTVRDALAIGEYEESVMLNISLSPEVEDTS